MRSLHSIFLLFFFFAAPLYAAPKDDLKKVQDDFESVRSNQEHITGERRKLEAELKDIQTQLVESASFAQKAESDLAEGADKLRIISEQLRLKNQALEARRKSLAALTKAALNLSRMPPEAMVALEGGAEAMKAAPALKMTSDSIREDMASIQVQADELKRLKEKMEAKRAEVVKQQNILNQERKKLQQKLADRQSLQEKLGLRQKEEAERAEDLAKKAQDLQSLVSNIKKGKGAPAPLSAAGGRRSFAHAKGRLHLPLEGTLAKRFGARDGGDGVSRGIAIAPRATGAQVVAPFDGEVVFSGLFLNYGKLVILRHSDDFHTLLAGLSDIHVAVGDFLLEGEPIGAMGESTERARLYVELRKNNQPVDPTPWIRGLSKSKKL